MSTSKPKLSAGKMVDHSSTFQEVKAEGKELWDLVTHLRDLCSRPISLRHECLTFVQSLAELRDQLAMAFAEEEACGAVFHNNKDNKLAQRALGLQVQHRALYVEISQLVEHAETLFVHHQPATIAIVIPEEFENFFHKLEEHEWNERELIYVTLEHEEDDGD